MEYKGILLGDVCISELLLCNPLPLNYDSVGQHLGLNSVGSSFSGLGTLLLLLGSSALGSWLSVCWGNGKNLAMCLLTLSKTVQSYTWWLGRERVKERKDARHLVV